MLSSDRDFCQECINESLYYALTFELQPAVKD
jgi:hypothetical protein